jgi:hypothetical protein
MKGAPITEGHHGMINPDNVKQHRVGHVSEDVTHGDRLVDAVLVIEDRATINRVNAKELVEISAGYSMDVEFTDGEYEGKRYDAIQRNIRYNHVALLPKDKARGGNELCLRLDSKDDNGTAIAVHLDSKDTGTPVDDNPKTKEIAMKKITIRLDGVDYEVEVPEVLASNFSASISKLQKEHTKTVERLDSLQGELDAAKQANTDLQTKYEADTNPQNIEKAVTARVKLVQDCKKLHPEIKADGKDDKELKLEALEKAGLERTRFDGKSDGYIDGFFYSKLETSPAASGKTPSVGVSPAPEVREDGKPERTAEQARADMIKRGQEAYLGEVK